MLLGCDYLDPVRGVGPKKALKLIQEHKTLDAVLEHLGVSPAKAEEPLANDEKNNQTKTEEEAAPKKRSGIQVPDFWPYKEARQLFEKPNVLDGANVQVCFLSN